MVILKLNENKEKLKYIYFFNINSIKLIKQRTATETNCYSAIIILLTIADLSTKVYFMVQIKQFLRN